MTQVLGALGSGLRDLFRPRILAIVLVPTLAAIAIWALMSWLFWDDWDAALNGLLASTAVARWIQNWGAGWVLQSAAILITVALLVPLVFITAMVVTEIVAMPAIVALVGERYFPGLQKRHGGTVAGSMANSALAIAVFAALWIATLPLWLLGILALLLPALLSAYLNQRLFRYDALADHAGPDEYGLVVERAKGRLYLLGLFLAALYYVPVFNLLVPVLSGLAFTHLCLAELQALRSGARR